MPSYCLRTYSIYVCVGLLENYTFIDLCDDDHEYAWLKIIGYVHIGNKFGAFSNE